MLTIKSNCEHCGTKLPPDSTEAMICSFECTFCTECVNDILDNVCPNCGGGFEKRPVRPKSLLIKYPAEQQAYIKEVNLDEFAALRKRNKAIAPNER